MLVGSETRHIPKIPARSYPAWLGGTITSEYSVTRVQTLEVVSYRSTIAFRAERRPVLFEAPAISRIMSQSPPIRRLATISECLTIHKCQAFGMWPGRETQLPSRPLIRSQHRTCSWFGNECSRA